MKDLIQNYYNLRTNISKVLRKIPNKMKKEGLSDYDINMFEIKKKALYSKLRKMDTFLGEIKQKNLK